MKNRQNDKVSIESFISNKLVDVLVFYKHKADWDIENGRQDINRLWRNFNLVFIGYKRDCLVLNYKAKDRFSFQFSKKINDAINNQEKYLRTVKVQVPTEES